MSHDCLTCGACCFADSPEYIRMNGRDHARLGDDAERLSQFIGNRCYMRMQDGHCIALEIKGLRYVCTIYERRPGVCRELMRGTPACLAELHAKKGRALRALERAKG